MKRVLRHGAVVLVVLAALMGLGGCKDKKKSASVGANGSDGASTVDQGRALKTISPGKLTVCSDIPNAPFEFEEGGELRGIDIDLVKAITGRLGISPDFRDTDRGALFSSLKSGQCDLVAAAVAITDERKKDSDFSNPYFEIHQSLLVRKANEGAYHDLPDLRGKPVGALAGSAGAEMGRKADSLVLREFPGPDALFAALTSSQVEAVLTDEPLNAYRAVGDAEAVVVVKSFRDEAGAEYGLAVPKGKKDLLDAVNKAMTEVRSDDSYRTILANYLASTIGQA